jgi:FtsH-binding integral membrane protein
LETYPVLAGIKGGIGGGIAMVIPALIYGLISEHSIWYPINLLGGAGVANWRNPTTADIAAFHWQGLLVASVIHITSCLLVGLLYGAMLPMMPRRPIVLGGVVAPLLWTGLLHSSISTINPVLASRISWGWFLVSQVTFGIVAGAIVTRSERIRTAQSVPFLARIGIQTPGNMRRRDDDQRES